MQGERQPELTEVRQRRVAAPQEPIGMQPGQVPRSPASCSASSSPHHKRSVGNRPPNCTLFCFVQLFDMARRFPDACGCGCRATRGRAGERLMTSGVASRWRGSACGGSADRMARSQSALSRPAHAPVGTAQDHRQLVLDERQIVGCDFDVSELRRADIG